MSCNQVRPAEPLPAMHYAMTRWLGAAVTMLWIGTSIAAAQTSPAAQTPPAAKNLLAAPAAPAKRPRPTQAVPAAQCATAGCHADVKQFPVVHGPVNVDGCDACHKLVDPAKHTYGLQRQGADVCTFCHQINTERFPVQHKPVQDGQCLACHNPHGGQTKRFTRGKTTGELCAACHKSPIGDNKHVHGPVAAGACDSCHTAHGGAQKNLLTAEGKSLCYACHTEMKAQLAQVKFPHKAVEQDCTACHDPHASNYTMMVKQAPVALCTSCHEKQKKSIEQAKVKHTVVTQGDACVNCHTAHGGNLAALMKAEPLKVCMNCHSKPTKTPDGQVVRAMNEVKDPRLVKHGPIRDGNCSGCHDTHGSANDKLLIKPYPEAFYQPFSVDKYALCFTCHDQQLVLTAEARGLTGFRNGEENLHFVHVNKPDRGRSCRACHNAHASPNELHVRDSVPYGGWQMPINFKKSETGGSCSPGCHKPYEYNRPRPVDYKALGAPTTAAALAR